MKIEDEGGAFENVSFGITFFFIPLVKEKKYVLWDAACLTLEEVFEPMTMGY